MNEQNQPNKINLLHQNDVQPDIKQDFPEKPNKTGLPKWVITLIIILGIIAIGTVGYAVYNYYFTSDEPIVCTMDAKICPDGSSVGRIAPMCEFAECPEIVDPTANWKTYRNEEYRFIFKYPGNIIAKEYNEPSVEGSRERGVKLTAGDLTITFRFDNTIHLSGAPEKLISKESKTLGRIDVIKSVVFGYQVLPEGTWVLSYDFNDSNHEFNTFKDGTDGINSILKSTEDLMEQILSTFKFIE